MHPYHVKKDIVLKTPWVARLSGLFWVALVIAILTLIAGALTGEWTLVVFLFGSGFLVFSAAGIGGASYPVVHFRKDSILVENPSARDARTVLATQGDRRNRAQNVSLDITQRAIKHIGATRYTRQFKSSRISHVIIRHTAFELFTCARLYVVLKDSKTIFLGLVRKKEAVSALRSQSIPFEDEGMRFGEFFVSYR